MTRGSVCTLLILLSISGLGGCGNFSSRYFDLKNSTVGTDIGGLPFTLNKPQFTVTRTPGTDKAPDTFQVAITYVQDPSQSYVAKMTPFWSASIDWTMSYDDNGSLSDTNGKATDQSVALLTSLVSIATAAGALDRSSPGTDAKRYDDIHDSISKDLDRQSPLLFDEATRTCSSASSQAEIRTLRAVWAILDKTLSDLANAHALDTFTYQSVQQRRVLETYLCTKTKVWDPSHWAWDPSEKISGVVSDAASANDAVLKAADDLLIDRFVHFDLVGVNAIKKAAAQRRSQLMAKAAHGVPVSTDSDDKILVRASVVLKALGGPEVGTILAMTQMDIVAWQVRRIKTLNAQIAARMFEDRATTARAGRVADIELKDRALVELKREKARVLGLLSVYDQTTVLAGVGPLAKNYKDAQALLGDLRKQLADAESVLTPDVAGSRPDDPVLATTLFPPDLKLVNEGWIVSQLKDQRPDYVVVVAPATADTPPVPSLAPPSAAAAPATPNVSQATATGTVPATPDVPVQKKGAQ